MNSFNKNIRIYLPISEMELKPAVKQDFDKDYEDDFDISD